MQLNRHIDHTLLKNLEPEEKYKALYSEALKYNFFSVCVPPSQTKKALSYLKNSNVKTCSVAGFPMGYSSLQTKVNEINELYNIGCHEVDVVLNILNVKAKAWDFIENELKAYSKISQNNVLKVIVESGSLNDNELLNICKIFSKYPTSFIKTSTGFSDNGASLKAVAFMKQNLPPKIQIKASGGIRTHQTALAFLQAGASRLGCSNSVNIIKGQNSEDLANSTY